MASRRARLNGEPSGLRIRIPRAGMRVSNSSHHLQVELPSWADPELPPAEWKPPEPNFEDSNRQIRFAQLIAKLKTMAHPPDGPHLQRLSALAESGEPLPGGEEELAALSAELEAITKSTSDRLTWLHQKRHHLQSIAHEDLTVRTRRGAEPPRASEADAAASMGASPARAAAARGGGEGGEVLTCVLKLRGVTPPGGR